MDHRRIRAAAACLHADPAGGSRADRAPRRLAAILRRHRRAGRRNAIGDAGMMNAYLEELGHALSFDRALSRCVVQEIEDHLSEAIAADPAPDRLEAERRAIANFGNPRLLAAQFAVV